jgi:hypothetical protein
MVSTNFGDFEEQLQLTEVRLMKDGYTVAGEAQKDRNANRKRPYRLTNREKLLVSTKSMCHQPWNRIPSLG